MFLGFGVAKNPEIFIVFQVFLDFNEIFVGKNYKFLLAVFFK